MTSVDLPRFSRIVEALYDAALDASRWSAALDLVADAISAATCSLHFIDVERQLLHSAFVNGEDSAQKKFERQQFVDNGYAQMWALQAGIASWPVGKPMHLPDILPEEEFLAGRFYRECIEPLGQRDYIGMVAMRAGTRMVKSSNGRLVSKGAFQPEERELFSLLAPHICRAVAISDALDVRALAIEGLHATLSELATAVYLVAENGRVVYMNRAAEEQQRSSQVVRLRDGRLRAGNATVDQELNAAILAAIGKPGERRGSGHSLALSGNGGTGLIAHTLPLQRGNEQIVLTQLAAAAAVFVQDIARTPPLPTEAFAQLYGLTMREMQILHLLLPGRSLFETADILGISQTTVKTHLANLFAKTGTSRQSELLALATRAASPVSPLASRT